MKKITFKYEIVCELCRDYLGVSNKSSFVICKQCSKKTAIVIPKLK